DHAASPRAAPAAAGPGPGAAAGWVRAGRDAADARAGRAVLPGAAVCGVGPGVPQRVRRRGVAPGRGGAGAVQSGVRLPHLRVLRAGATPRDRKSTRLNSSHVSISYAVFCLKKKNHFLFIPILLFLLFYV